MFGADRVPKCQHVAALHARVGAIPAIRAWIEKRPATPFWTKKIKQKTQVFVFLWVLVIKNKHFSAVVKIDEMVVER